MGLAQQVRLASNKSDIRSRDFSIILGYAAFSIVLSISICWAAGQPGTSPLDFASMTVFP